MGRGKTFGSVNCKLYKWEILYLNKRSNEIITNKFSSITHLNKELNMSVKNEEVYRELHKIKEPKKLDEYNALGRHFLKQDLKLLEIKKIHETI